MKICTKCHVEKSEESFHLRDKRTGLRRKQCKECVNAALRGDNRRYVRNKQAYIDRNHRRRAETRKALYEYMQDKACETCGYNKSIAALQFDHINPAKKRAAISQLVKDGHS